MRSRIETAERLGIAPRRLDGWEPTETTTYEYDGGRLVRSVTVREPEWSDTDRAWMAALAAYRDGYLCPCGCGHPVEQTTAHENDGRRWVVPPPVRCQARTALAIAQANFDNPQPEAMLWRVERR